MVALSPCALMSEKIGLDFGKCVLWGRLQALLLQRFLQLQDIYIYILEELSLLWALKHQKQRSMDAQPALTLSALNCCFSCCSSSKTSKRVLSASGLCFGFLAGSSRIVPKFANRFRQHLDLSTLISLILPQHIIIPTYLARLF